MAAVLPIAKQQYFDSAGNPLAGGKLYTYDAGTSNPRATWADAAATVPNANPVVLDARGEATIFWQGAYKAVLKTAADVTVWTVDGIESPEPAGGSSALTALLAGRTTVAQGSGAVGHSALLEYSSDDAGFAINAPGRAPQGVDNTGATVCTTALRAHFDYCIARGLRVLLSGTYLVDGPISSPLQIAAGGLHIKCAGDVTINVSGGAAAFTSLLSCYTTAINSSSISGGRLTLNLNNRCSNGLYLRHDAAADGGSVDWRCVTVTNAKENNAGSVAENQGLLVYGRYTAVTLDRCIVDGVTRTNAAGFCKGISISEVVGEVRVLSPSVARVLTGGGANDADGIAVFGRQLNGVYGRRAGRLVMVGGTFTDCQGRSIKAQVSDALIDRPVMEHQAVVTIASGSDIDAQVGGSVVVRSPIFTYRLNGATTPIGTGFYPVSLQQQCTDAPNDMQVLDPLVRTEAVMTRFAYVTVGASSAAGRNAVSGLQVQPLGAFSGCAFTRAVVEFDAEQVAASSGATHISLRNARADLSGVPLLGYTGFGASVTGKLSIDVVSNEHTGAANSATSVLAAVSGGNIPALQRFMVRDNANVNDFLGLTSFDFATLPVGCRFHYSAVTAAPTNGPALGGAGIACVEVLGQVNAGAGSRSIRVVKDNASVANTVYQTQTGTWGVIK